jgi:hypothetical protein
MEGLDCVFIALYALNLAIVNVGEQKQGGERNDHGEHF